MFGPINPEGERIRAQAILCSLTEYRETVELFAPGEQNYQQFEMVEPAANTSRHNGQPITRVFRAIKLNLAAKRA